MKLFISKGGHSKVCSHYRSNRSNDDRGYCVKGCKEEKVSKGAVCPFDIEGRPDSEPKYQHECDGFNK